mgnify:CR=1 FL=1
MHDKNSRPDKEFSNAKSATFLSGVAAPTSIIFGETKFKYENLELNLIVTPLTPPSRNKVLEPAPKILIFSRLTSFQKKNPKEVLKSQSLQMVATK